MAHYEDIENAIVSKLLEFGSVKENNLQKFKTITNEVAGFLIKNIGKDSDLQISEVYDCSDGDRKLLGAVAVIPGIDLCGGYFESGVFSSKNPLDVNNKFYRVDHE